MAHEHRSQPFAPPRGLRAAAPHHPVAVVGAGPVGLAMAIDLAGQGIATVLVDAGALASGACCATSWSGSSLRILDRLGVGDACRKQGLALQAARIFRGETELFNLDLRPAGDLGTPGFVNLRQDDLEALLLERARACAEIDLRPRDAVIGVMTHPDHVVLRLATPEGSRDLECGWAVACDGPHSPLRAMMSLDLEGETFDARFLVADIEMEAGFPPERWFWFDPPFHDGRSALLHRLPGNLFRIDLQLDPEADPETERRPERVIPRIARIVGHEDFRLDRASVRSMRCGRLGRLVHGRVIFAGDAAHVVAPFGARGGNSGLRDVDALGWRLAAVLRGEVSERALDAYDRERCQAADENMQHAARAMRFISPADGAERLFRDAILDLAESAPFARPMINSGRLSQPCTYRLRAPDDPRLPEAARPGVILPDAPLAAGWLSATLGGGFALLAIGQEAPLVAGLRVVDLSPRDPATRTRLLGQATRALYLVRPDQVVAARWVEASALRIGDAWRDAREGWT